MFKHEGLVSQQKETKAMERSPEFATAGYYFLIILLLTITGFLIPFAQTWGDASIQFPPIIHIHAGLMTSWLLMLIAQPFLILWKRETLHMLLGKLSYVLMPLVMASILWLTYESFSWLEGRNRYLSAATQVMDGALLLVCYLAAIYHRKNPAVHARWMIGSALAVAEPGLTRTLIAILPMDPDVSRGISLSLLLLVVLILRWRDHRLAVYPKIFSRVLVLVLILGLFVMIGSESEGWKAFVDEIASI